MDASASVDIGNLVAGLTQAAGSMYAADLNSDDMKWQAKYNHAANLEAMARANEYNSAEAALGYARQVALYEKQFADQLKSEGTKYQRTMADLRKAGVNPLLAFQGMNASAASSSSPSVPYAGSASGGSNPASLATRGSLVSDAFKGLGSAAKAVSGLDLKEKLAQTKEAEGRANLVESQIANTNADTQEKLFNLTDDMKKARYNEKAFSWGVRDLYNTVDSFMEGVKDMFFGQKQSASDRVLSPKQADHSASSTASLERAVNHTVDGLSLSPPISLEDANRKRERAIHFKFKNVEPSPFIN